MRERDKSSAAEAEALDAERREALRKLGKYAAYTAPVMLAMLESEAAIAQTIPL